MTLNPREYQCAMLVAQGCADKEIARRLDLSLTTVKRYVRDARLKTGAQNRLQLALMFARGEVQGPRLREVA